MAKQDSGQFVRLWIQHQNDLLRAIAPLVGSVNDAQDVLQETALALWRKFDKYDQRQPFLPWAKQFAKYEVLMYHRRRQRYTFLSEQLIDALAERQKEAETIGENHRRVLADCMNHLRDSDQRLLRLRYAEPGTTIQQIAEATGQTANALYKTLQRIRRQLLLCIERKLAYPEG
ncbi:sigma-70 family RNA polymerase sigma factor [Anaerobaca lacustris]|uniref:Sigma-70 family RNA polymerase sigma factor n=1 Tax=Anaerobaca lacustris TaxID=3044600 RepID=A0AAW6U712_9BACT|nr:sigma-70 family RNA polymerase sigma factor [Sedimentisphaerales bacterium M17dextr]